jgi:tetratricopeptide (TPR) repeat protein
MIEPRIRMSFTILFLSAAACVAVRGADAGSVSPWIARIDSLRVESRADSALSVIAKALPIAESSADSTLILELWVRQGELQSSLGFAREGEAVLRRALGLARARDDTAKACVALRWLSVAVGSQGRTDEAAKLCRVLLSLAQTRRDRIHEAWARVGLAWSAETIGRDDEALEEYRLAAELFHGGNAQRGEAWARNGLGNALTGLGRYEEARRSYREAEDLAERAGYRMVEGLAANNLGTLEYLLGDPGAAVEHFRRALAVRREIPNVREWIIPRLNLALCDADLGRLEAASDSLTAMIAVCREGGYADLAAKVTNQLAQTRGLQGRAREARSLYRSTIAMGTGVPMKNRVEAATGLAESLREADSTIVALRLLEQTLAWLDDRSDPTWRMRIDIGIGESSLDLQDAPGALPHLQRAVADARRLSLPALREQALLDLGRAWREVNRPDSALAAWNEASRLWEEVRGAASDPEWREVRGAQARSLCTDMTFFLLSDGAGPDRLREAYDRAQRFKTRTLIERMQGPAGKARPPDSIATLERLQGAILDSNEVLLDFFLGPRVSYLFAVSRDSSRVTVLPPEKTLSAMVLLYHDLLRTPPSGDVSLRALDEAGRRLHAILLADVEDLIRARRRIYVSPDGVLNLIPFGPSGASDSAESEWIRIPSATVLDLLRSRGRPTQETPCSVLAYADKRGPSGDLPGAEQEVEHLVSRYRDTEARFLTERDTVRLDELGVARSVVHFASHSEANDQRPWLSRIGLGGAGLRADQIAAARIPVPLAVLASCQTQHGRVLSGEGTLGLSTALLSAGSECVVATLWPVDDRITARLMRRFYAGLASGRTVAGALRQAQAEIRRGDGTAHPFYWAGFVAIGRGELRIPLRVRTQPWTNPAAIAAGAALPLLALILWVQRARQKRSVIFGPGKRPMG